MKRCPMCNKDVPETITFINNRNGNVLSICPGCAVICDLIPQPPGTHWECMYCGHTKAAPDPDEPDILICERCGEYWEDCKILVPDFGTL